MYESFINMTSRSNSFLQYLYGGVSTVLFLQSKPLLLTFLLSVSLLMSLLPLCGHHGYIVFKQNVIRVICDNNETFHKTITRSKDNKNNCLYSQLIKSILDNFLN